MATCTGAWRWYRPRVRLTARSSEKDVGSFSMISCLALPAWHSTDTVHDTVIAVTPLHLSVNLLTDSYAVHQESVQQACACCHGSTTCHLQDPEGSLYLASARESAGSTLRY